MHAVKVDRSRARVADLVGRVVCQDLRHGDGRPAIAKGRVLDEADASLALELTWSELHLLQLDPADVHEDEAGARLARAAAALGVEVGPLSGGHRALVATTRGLLTVDAAALHAVNSLAGPCLYTLYSGQVVDAGEVVARAKITPFAVPRAVIERAEVEARGAVAVHAFAPRRVAAVVNETLGERALERFRTSLDEKVGWFGSTLVSIEIAGPSAEEIATALEGVRRSGAEVITVAGTKAMDVLDPTFAALGRLGVTMERHGVPAHPGSLLWLAAWDGVPIIGMPSCGLFAKATVFDLVLAMLLGGRRVDAHELAALGHGGLLTRAMAFRFPAYRSAAERGALE